MYCSLPTIWLLKRWAVDTVQGRALMGHLAVRPHHSLMDMDNLPRCMEVLRCVCERYALLTVGVVTCLLCRQIAHASGIIRKCWNGSSQRGIDHLTAVWQPGLHVQFCEGVPALHHHLLAYRPAWRQHYHIHVVLLVTLRTERRGSNYQGEH